MLVIVMHERINCSITMKLLEHSFQYDFSLMYRNITYSTSIEPGEGPLFRSKITLGD